MSELGVRLRRWRAERRVSQLALATEAGMSQRHLSYVESGRARPSRGALLRLSAALDVPLRERNVLLLEAGFAPSWAEGGWDEARMRPVRAAVERMLRQQEPFPAVMMDPLWNVLAANEAAPRFFGSFVDLDARPRPRNMLRLMFAEDMRPHLRNWPDAAAALIGRVRREAVGHVIDDATQALLASLERAAGIGRARAADAVDAPVVPLSFVKDGETLEYFSIVSRIGAPAAVAAEELRVECMFPADEATERRHLALFGAGAGSGAA